PILHLELRRELRRLEIAEQKRDRTALDGGRGWMSAGARRRWRRRLEIRDRLHQALARPNRNAKLLQIGFGQLGQDVPVDFARAKHGLVLAETNTVEPLADSHPASLCGPIIGETETSVERVLLPKD